MRSVSPPWPLIWKDHTHPSWVYYACSAHGQDTRMIISYTCKKWAGPCKELEWGVLSSLGLVRNMWPLLSECSSVGMVGWTFEAGKMRAVPKHLKGILYLPLLRPFPYRCVMLGWIPFEIAPAAGAEAGHRKYWKHITLEILLWDFLISFIFILCFGLLQIELLSDYFFPAIQRWVEWSQSKVFSFSLLSSTPSPSLFSPLTSCWWWSIMMLVTYLLSRLW